MEKFYEALNEYGVANLLAVGVSSKFTRWLLENDRIDLEKMDKALEEDPYINKELPWTNLKLIKLLSTKEDPIAFLSTLIK